MIVSNCLRFILVYKLWIIILKTSKNCNRDNLVKFQVIIYTFKSLKLPLTQYFVSFSKS